jgi:hypothetical protein
MSILASNHLRAYFGAYYGACMPEASLAVSSRRRTWRKANLP